MPSYKVALIANGEAATWASWPGKITAIKAFYAPLVTLEIDLKYTNFPDIPTASYPGTVTQFGPNGAQDVAGEDLEIDQTWFNTNIGPLIAGYDIAIFQTTNVTATGLPLGIKFEQLNGTWCAETFVTDENFDYILPNQAGSGVGINLGNEAEIIIEHEIAHALYSITGQTDNTHKFFYANQFSRVLTDIVFPNQSAITILYQKVIADLDEELGLLKADQSTADNAPPTVQKATYTPNNNQSMSETSFPAKILAWARITAQEEGANPELHNPGNLAYTTLTASWGAAKGPAKSDGGFLSQFPTDEAGENALCNFLLLGCEDELVAFHQARTLAEFTKIYAGNPPAGYTDAIVNAMGGDPNVQISTFLA